MAASRDGRLSRLCIERRPRTSVHGFTQAHLASANRRKCLHRSTDLSLLGSWARRAKPSPLSNASLVIESREIPCSGVSTSADSQDENEKRDRSGGKPLTSLATWMRENAVFSCCELVPVRHRVSVTTNRAQIEKCATPAPAFSSW